MGGIFKKEDKKDIELYDKGLEKTRKEFVSNLSFLGHKYTKVNDEYFDELESILIKADIGVNTTYKFLDKLKKRVKEVKYLYDSKRMDIYKAFCTIMTYTYSYKFSDNKKIKKVINRYWYEE